MNFLSDNAAPVAPAILDAVVQANEGFASAYGDDDWTRSVEHRFAELFEREVAVFLLPTGTAANALALAHVTPPWGAVLCHADSHVATDECGAPEFFGGGLKLVELPGGDGKITTETLKRSLADQFGHSPHQMIASALSITQATEVGTVYRQAEIAALCKIAHQRSLAVHMDGARFANALVRLNATPAQITWQSGVDVLSFGVTKLVRSPRKVLCFSIRRAPTLWPNVASAPVISFLSIDSSPHNLRRSLRMADGSPSPATPISRLISSQPSSPLSA